MRNFDERRSAVAYFMAKGMSEREANAAFEGVPQETEPRGSDAEIVALLRACGMDEANLDDGVRRVRELLEAKKTAATEDEPFDRYEPEFGFPIAPWHRWFAWRPVETLDRGVQWMRPLWRRRIHIYAHLDMRSGNAWWQYAIDIDQEQDA